MSLSLLYCAVFSLLSCLTNFNYKWRMKITLVWFFFPFFYFSISSHLPFIGFRRKTNRIIENSRVCRWEGEDWKITTDIYHRHIFSRFCHSPYHRKTGAQWVTFQRILVSQKRVGQSSHDGPLCTKPKIKKERNENKYRVVGTFGTIFLNGHCHRYSSHCGRIGTRCTRTWWILQT